MNQGTELMSRGFLNNFDSLQSVQELIAGLEKFRDAGSDFSIIDPDAWGATADRAMSLAAAQPPPLTVPEEIQVAARWWQLAKIAQQVIPLKRQWLAARLGLWDFLDSMKSALDEYKLAPNRESVLARMEAHRECRLAIDAMQEVVDTSASRLSEAERAMSELAALHAEHAEHLNELGMYADGTSRKLSAEGETNHG
jgi:hypothetical protein